MTGSRRRCHTAAAAPRWCVAAAAVVVVAAVAGCGPASTETLPEQPEAPGGPAAAVDPAPVTTRPPLSDPPDPGPAPEHHGLAPEELAAAVASSVRVTGPGCRAIVREGSGFAVGDGDLVVTVAHLMVGLSEPVVELADGRVLEAVPVAIDRANDLAVLRVDGAELAPLPLTEAVPDGTVGAVLAWEAEGEPDPTPFRIDRPITARTDGVAGEGRVERPSWLLAAAIELGDSGAALVAPVEGRLAALGVMWSSSRRGGVDVAYATRAGALERLLATSDLDQRVEVPECP